MAGGGRKGSDGAPCVSLGCATGAALAVEVGEGSLPHCTRALLAPQEVLEHKRCSSFRNATSDFIQGVCKGMTFRYSSLSRS